MKKRVAIIGAGPAGLSLAYKLLNRDDLEMEVILIEEQPMIGGSASGFEHEGIYFDYGSHKLHPGLLQDILRDIIKLIGDDLIACSQQGRIRLYNKYIPFPLKLSDILSKLPLSYIAGIIGVPFRKKKRNPQNLAETLLATYGKTICETYYFPYARKLWGLEPREISVYQADVKTNSLNRSSKTTFSFLIPFLRPKGKNKFYYPRFGFIQIFEKMMIAIRKKGGQFMLANKLTEIHEQPDKKLLCVLEDGSRIAFDMVFTTGPVTDLIRMLKPEPPIDVIKAALNTGYRSMIFCYLMLNTSQLTPYDTHYYPGTEFIFSRISEPKLYRKAAQPENLTGLCVEIPCSVGDEIWNWTDEQIIKRVLLDLEKAGFEINSIIKESFIKRMTHAYPIYDHDFEKKLLLMNDYLLTIPGLVVLGKHGLFNHDNTHHSMETAYKAAACLKAGGVWSVEQWSAILKEFKSLVTRT